VQVYLDKELDAGTSVTCTVDQSRRGSAAHCPPPPPRPAAGGSAAGTASVSWTPGPGSSCVLLSPRERAAGTARRAPEYHGAHSAGGAAMPTPSRWTPVLGGEESSVLLHSLKQQSVSNIQLVRLPSMKPRFVQ
jgi:hypothetical protein